jgi:hypothetical protein
VPGEIIVIAIVAVGVAAVAWGIVREDARLKRRARRYRQLEFEGIEELRRDDPYPEDTRVEGGGYLREPDGRRLDADRVLREELERARDYTRRVRARRSRARTLRRGRGAECLL